MFGYTGSKRNKVTIHGSKRECLSLSIYVNELIKDYNVKTLIRIGSAGGMQKKVNLRDIVIAQTASSVSTPSSTIFKELNLLLVQTLVSYKTPQSLHGQKTEKRM